MKKHQDKTIQDMLDKLEEDDSRRIQYSMDNLKDGDTVDFHGEVCKIKHTVVISKNHLTIKNMCLEAKENFDGVLIEIRGNGNMIIGGRLSKY